MMRILSRLLVAMLALTPAASAADNPTKIVPKLAPLIELVAAGKKAKAKTLLSEMTKSGDLNPTQLLYAKIAVDSFDQTPKMPEPSLIELDVAKVALSDCKWSQAKVGYLEPLRNVWMRAHPEFRFLETAEGIHRKGIYAHANSQYTFDLGGRWEKFEGSAALGYRQGKLPYPYTSVDFIIKVDGEIVFSRRRKDKNLKPAEFSISVRNAKKLTLITTDAANGTAGDHGLWISPILSRPRR